VRRLPEIDPGDPNLGSPWSFYRWLARRQAGQIASGAVLSAVAAGSFSSIPAWVGGAVQALTSGAPRPVFHGWIGLIALTGLVGVVAGLMEHRVGVAIRLTAGLRVQRLVVRHAGHLGVTLSRRLASGDAVALSGIESAHVGFSLTAVARAVGSLAAIGVVTAVLLSFSTVLGLLAVGGVVLVLAVIGVLLPPLERRLREVRDRVRDTADVAADAIAGLRVIRGIGAGSVVLERYRAVSRRLRTAATASAGRQSDLDAAQVLLPGLLVVSVSWVGARMALTGQITAGDLVAYYGYVMFLLLPFSSVIDAGGSVVRGLVAVRRIHGLLVVERDLDEPQDAPEVPLPAGPLVDHDYRLTIPPGASVGIVCDSTTEASSIGDRLARYVDADVTLGGVRLDRIARRLCCSAARCATCWTPLVVGSGSLWPRPSRARPPTTSWSPSRTAPTACWPSVGAHSPPANGNVSRWRGRW
jgi:ABC-type multidrug transport system fused ATPase/permease subunit